MSYQFPAPAVHRPAPTEWADPDARKATIKRMSACIDDDVRLSDPDDVERALMCGGFSPAVFNDLFEDIKRDVSRRRRGKARAEKLASAAGAAMCAAAAWFWLIVLAPSRAMAATVDPAGTWAGDSVWLLVVVVAFGIVLAMVARAADARAQAERDRWHTFWQSDRTPPREGF